MPKKHRDLFIRGAIARYRPRHLGATIDYPRFIPSLSRPPKLCKLIAISFDSGEIARIG